MLPSIEAGSRCLYINLHIRLHNLEGTQKNKDYTQAHWNLLFWENGEPVQFGKVQRSHCEYSRLINWAGINQHLVLQLLSCSLFWITQILLSKIHASTEERRKVMEALSIKWLLYVTDSISLTAGKLATINASSSKFTHFIEMLPLLAAYH